MLLDSRSAIEAIGVLDRAPVSAKFVLVINENNELVGTISDGDIRRGLMRGVDINGPFHYSCMSSGVYLLSMTLLRLKCAERR